MRLSKYILIVLLIPSCVMAADEWTAQDTIMQTLGSSLWVIDCLQSVEIARSEDYWETNSVLGKHPSEETVYTYFTGAIIGSLVIAKLLPSTYRKYWQGLFIGVGYASVIHNHNLGVRINF